MADSSNASTEIQTPRLVKEKGYDLHTVTAGPEAHYQLQPVLVAQPLDRNHGLVKETSHEYARCLPLATGGVDQNRSLWPVISDSIPPDMSFFNATLMALFHISPFINFLEEAVAKKEFKDPILEELHSLHQEFRGLGSNEKSDDERRLAIKSRMDTVWTLMAHVDQATHYSGQASVGEVVDFVLDRIEWAKLQIGHVDPAEVNLSTRFKQLFKFYTIPYAPMFCNCQRPVLRRQKNIGIGKAGYVFPVEVRDKMTLAEAISESMWVDRKEKRTCPVCRKDVQVHEFLKFAYLPEVLQIFTTFTMRNEYGKVWLSRNAKLNYPERLDLSELRDDPRRPGDDSNCVYKLESIVAASDASLNAHTHYKSFLRINENKWLSLDDRPSPKGSIDYSTFEGINNSDDKPNLLVYVRERKAPAKGKPDGLVVTSRDGGDSDPYHLEKFLNAQNQRFGTGKNPVYIDAERELQRGKKIGNWMWHMFPQVDGLSSTQTDQHYAIKSLGEARAYWAHTQLKSRYKGILYAVLVCSKDDLNKVFGSEVDSNKFLASVTLFRLICDSSELMPFEEVREKFSVEYHRETLYAVIRWLNEAKENGPLTEACNVLRHILDKEGNDNESQHSPEHVSTPAGKHTTTPASKDRGDKAGPDPEHLIACPPLSSSQTPSVTLSNNGSTPGPGKETSHDNQKNPGNEDDSDASYDPEYNSEANKIGSTLLELANIEPGSLERLFSGDALTAAKQRVSALGRFVLEMGQVEGTPKPPTPEFNERARRLGGHLSCFLYHKALFNFDTGPPLGAGDKSDAESGFGGGWEPNQPPGGGSPSGGPFDGRAFSEVQEGFAASPLAHSNHREARGKQVHELLAIPYDPADRRITACQTWTIPQFREALRIEVIEGRGLSNDIGKYRAKFLKHFELEKDYSIYHEKKLRQVVKEKCPFAKLSSNKAKLVTELEDYDRAFYKNEFVTGNSVDESDAYDPDGPDSEEYQSSEASGTEAKYAAADRLVEQQKREEENAAQPRAAARAQKRVRADEGDEEWVPENRPSAYTRMRTR